MDINLSALGTQERSQWVPARSGRSSSELAATGDQVAAGATPSRVATDAKAPTTGTRPSDARSSEQLALAITALQQKAAEYAPALQFSVVQDTGQRLVKLTDTSTNTLIWQFPSDEAIQIAKEIDRYQLGLGLRYTA